MPIQTGETIPSMKLTRSTPDGPKETSVDEVFGGKTVVLFGVPGAFTGTCRNVHLSRPRRSRPRAPTRSPAWP